VSGGSEAADEDLEDAAFDGYVLRGGRFEYASSLRNARRVHEAYGTWGVCVTAGPAATADELVQVCRAGNEYLMSAQVSDVTADARFRVVREPGHDWPDALIIFPDAFCQEYADTLREVMSKTDPIPNPAYRGK
jgi:hypothetical protein